MQGTGPIFILSSARSGSTLARIILDTHPAIYSPPELNLGRMARDLFGSIGWLEGTHDLPMAESRAALERTRAVLAGLLAPYVERKGKAIWCEKSPDNVRFADLLAEVFPDARFLCLYRHPLDVAHSCIETFRYGFPAGFQEYLLGSPGDHVQALLGYWADAAEAAVGLERRHPERAFRLRYEDLVADPAGALAPFFAFLGLAWDPALLAAVFGAEHDRGPGDPYVYFTDRIRHDSLGAGRNLPVETLAEPLRERLRVLLAELGYPQRPAPAAGDGRHDGDALPDIRALFETLLPARAAAGAVPAASFACDVAVSGPGGGAWAIEWDDGGLRVTPGSRGLPAQIELDAADLLAIVTGQANPLKIAQEGRIRAEGLESDEALRGLLQLIWDPASGEGEEAAAGE